MAEYQYRCPLRHSPCLKGASTCGVHPCECLQSLRPSTQMPSGAAAVTYYHTPRDPWLLLPSSSLTWGPCTAAGLEAISTFVCATAVVPLDYRRPTWRNISLALIKHPATGEPSKRLGSVFSNPGGPGGSGIQALPYFVAAVPAAVTEVGGSSTGNPRPSTPPCGCIAEALRFFLSLK